ncbi:hypothetical protein [Rhodococcus sp. B10]|uniref:hypothetical protein n=1 Tax=Rhodococcus sp. B10 TaxID=2695876 RepID=UPI00142FAA1D|nr:hypothetical protein [Rhodococcus sp. B10]NIL77665.1 hypothetical protein [Rhodococcus sp. B10]
MTTLNVGDEITSLDQLVELPVGSIVRSGTARVAQKTWLATASEPDEWVETGDSTPITSSDLDDYPHRLLYIGGQE